MLTRKMFSSAKLCEYEVKQDSNIAVHFSGVRCHELNCSFYSRDSSNYKRNTFFHLNLFSRGRCHLDNPHVLHIN